MRRLFLLFQRLLLFPQFLDEQTHLPGSRVENLILAPEIQKIPQPLPIIGMTRQGDRPFLGQLHTPRRSRSESGA